MNEIQIFNHEEFGEIRTIEIDGQIYFVGVDVARALGYAKPRNAIKKYVNDDDALKWGVIDKLGRVQQTTVINESGFYSLVLSSKLPDAEKFQHWVTSEVLPSIRRTGTYSTLSFEEMFVKALDERIESAVNKVLDEKIEVAVNKVIEEKVEGIIEKAVTKAVSETVKALEPYLKTPELPKQTKNKIKCRPRDYQNGKIAGLPQNIKRQVDEMIISGKYSCQKIADFITENTGMEISYMTVSRYIKKYFKR